MPLADREGKMGWGHEHESDARKLYIEAIEQDENEKLFGAARYAEPSEAPDASDFIIEKIKHNAWWDEGWDFTAAERIVYGRTLQRGPQSHGNCVGYSHCLLLATKQAHSVLVSGQAEEVFGEHDLDSPVPFIPYTYGASRCLTSSNLCGPRDGSYCSLAIRASEEHGFLPSSTEGLPGRPPDPGSTIGRKWGSNKETLRQWREHAIKYDLLHSYRVRDIDKLWDALTVHFLPLQICSGWGFRPAEQITGDGVSFWRYKAGGSWAHAMQLLAGVQYKGERYYKVGNQWSDAHRDGDHFWVNQETMASWLKKADARTIGDIQGLPAPVDFALI